MSALGRGLASLIPRRESQNAKEVLDQIDSMEEIKETDVAASRSSSGRGEDANTPPAAAAAAKSIPVSEDFQDMEEMQDMPLPPKPNVTPLTMDPETGTLQDPASIDANSPAPAAPTKKQQVVITSLSAAPGAPSETKRPEAPASVPPPPRPVPPRPQPTPPEDEASDLARWDRHEGRVEHIAIGDIEVNPLQPRRNFDQDEMEELVQSIDQHGILQPLVVLRLSANTYELLAGERRLRAAKQLGWDKVPCVVRTDARTDRGKLELALIENIQRENLNPIEEAMGYKRLNEEFGMSHEEIGTRVGKSRVAITNIMRVLQLPAEIQRGLAEGKISSGHARAILMIPDEDKQIKFYQHLLDEGLTVRKAETRARRIQRQMKLNDPLRKKTRGRPALALKYDGLLEEKFGYNARVRFDELKNRFEVVFHAFSEKEAEELVQRLLGTTGTIEYPEDQDEVS